MHNWHADSKCILRLIDVRLVDCFIIRIIGLGIACLDGEDRGRLLHNLADNVDLRGCIKAVTCHNIPLRGVEAVSGLDEDVLVHESASYVNYLVVPRGPNVVSNILVHAAVDLVARVFWEGK